MKFLNFFSTFVNLWVIFALLDPDPLTRLNPDPIRIRIRNPARKREKAAATLPSSFFWTMSWTCWKEKLDPDPLTLLKSGSNPDPQPC
jgi:hypothetical protein